MQETLQALLGLQQIDRHIFDVQAELERLPLELARRREELEAKERRVAETRQRGVELRGESKEIEDYTTGLRQRQRKLEHESTTKKIDAALLASYEHEIRTIKRNVNQAEDEAIKKIEQSERLAQEAADLETQLKAEQVVFEEYRENVERELAAAEARHADLSREREALSADGIAPGHLELYRRLLKIRQGEALAELAEGHCQVCFVQIPKNLGVRLARGTELVQCPSCDRILFGR